MAAIETLTASIDEVIELFNTSKMDLPDGFFDRKAQFVLNGAPFETLLGQPPADPLILMLTRGPAGFRFSAKTLQHALTNARIARGDIVTDPSTPLTQQVESASLRAGGPCMVTTQLWLSGALRGTGEAVNTLVAVTLRLAAAGQVQVAEAVVEEDVLEKIRQARLRP
jgi:hypothetical protein